MPNIAANKLAGELKMRLRMVAKEAIQSGLRISDDRQPIPADIADRIRRRLSREDATIHLLVAELQAPRTWIHHHLAAITDQKFPSEAEAIIPASVAVQLRHLKTKQERNGRRLHLGDDADLAAELGLSSQTIQTARTVFSQTGAELGELNPLEQEDFNAAVCNLYCLAHGAILRALTESAAKIVSFIAGKLAEEKIGLVALAEQLRLTDDLIILAARHFDGRIQGIESGVSPAQALRLWAWATFSKALLTGKNCDEVIPALKNQTIPSLLNAYLGEDLAEELVAEIRKRQPEQRQVVQRLVTDQAVPSKPVLLIPREGKPEANKGQIILMADHRSAKDSAAHPTFVIDGLNICRLTRPSSLATLLALAVELLERGDDFICIFDASARWELGTKGMDKKITPNPLCDKLVKKYPQHFMQTPRGEEADVYLLNVAGDIHPIISNDGFKDYAGQFGWLKDTAQLRQRLIGGMAVRAELIIQSLKIRRKISGSADELFKRFEELVAAKSQLAAQTENVS